MNASSIRDTARVFCQTHPRLPTLAGQQSIRLVVSTPLAYPVPPSDPVMRKKAALPISLHDQLTDQHRFRRAYDGK
jgi:hypothetical protein